jgi:hypothetical protein
MASESQVPGTNANALFTLMLHRGEGMVLLGMNWRAATPPDDFVGFAIEYREPGGDRFFPLTNRINFPLPDGRVNHKRLSTRLSPIQKFRWVHFPRNADLPGAFVYRVVPVFMSAAGDLSFGEAQEAAVELRRDTYPRKLNVAFTRGFVLSQAFVDRFGGDVATLIPDDADAGLTFQPTHAKADEALPWMGFEAREAILAVLDAAVADPQAQVRVVAYELNEPRVLERLKALGGRLKIIIDNSDGHAPPEAAESQAELALVATAGRDNVKRQRMGNLQHNKTIVVDGPKSRAAVCGSTNFSWRGFYVQNNNAVILRTKPAVKHFLDAFDAYWHHDTPPFGGTTSAQFGDLGLTGITAQVGFSPYLPANSQLKKVADDIQQNAGSSVLYSLAFLWQTPGAIRNALKAVTADPEIFVYGISDKKVGGLDVQLPGGNVAPVSPQELGANVPEPFKSEPKALVNGSSGNRMHHKFVVVDFDKPSARVYLGSYNFSKAADDSNGENLMLIRDRRVALSYAIEALRIFDHYHFRVLQLDAKTAKKQLVLARPPRDATEKPWWDEDYSDPRKIRDRELFSAAAGP